ncbi:MAG TPA: hypothetical protein ENN09_03465 [Planctomycetes bacterium]|nr:hypothetical protein [Planctomycetota bacterium]
MVKRPGLLFVLAVLASGCGQKTIYTTTEKEVEKASEKRVSLAAMFDAKARTFVMRENAQERNAPFKPGYDARGETAPLSGTDAVSVSISRDWNEIVSVMELGEPYDYDFLGELGLRLVMRAKELQNARILELERRRVQPDRQKPDETDRAILRFSVLAKRFMLAASTRNPEDLVEVYTVFPASTPFISSGAY